MKALILLSCCLLPECANAAPSQAQAEKPAVPQTNIRVAICGAVVLDVVVTDKKNRVVTDLKQDDFVVYEDDAVQKVDSFQARTAVPAGSGRAGAPNMPASAASRAARDQESVSLAQGAAVAPLRVKRALA